MEKLITKITDNDFGLKFCDMEKPQLRKGARGIVIREDGKIAIFNKANKHEYKLPGGGIEEINIAGNTFTKIKRNPVYFCIQQNVGGGSNYKKVGMKITKEETKAMLDNKVSDCGYDMNSIFHGYDILYFKGSGERSRSNAVGVNINKQIISYGL